MARDKSQKPLTKASPEPDEQPSESSTDSSSSSSDDEQNQNFEKPTTDEKQSSDSDDEPISKLKSTVPTKPTTDEKQSSSSDSDSEPVRSKPSVAVAEKRPAENSPEKGFPKKPSKDKPSATPGSNEEGSKKLFQRVFSEDDEIAMLKGLIEFKERKGGAYPIKNDVEFGNFIQNLLHVEVNRVQIVDKVRRLKKKFNNAKNNNKKIMSEHEKKMFDLSKKIWEENDNEDDKLKVKSMSKSDDFKVGEDEAKEGMREEALRKMGVNGRAEIREMWRKVENAQLEVDLMRNAARVEENKKLMEALGLLKR